MYRSHSDHTPHGFSSTKDEADPSAMAITELAEYEIPRIAGGFGERLAPDSRVTVTIAGSGDLARCPFDKIAPPPAQSGHVGMQQ